MSEPKHTPGPWERRWTSTSTSEGTTETGRVVDAGGEPICHLVMTGDVDGNAALIAAAPDGLAAALLSISKGHHDTCSHELVAECACDCGYEALVAFAAKARGKS